MTYIKVIATALLCIYVLIGLIIFLMQESLIFLPETLPENYAYEFEQVFEEHNLAMSDGAMINALHFKQADSKGLIVYFHGNAGNLARWGEIVMPFVDLGYEVLIMDYRGYGKSTGNRSQKKMLEDTDDLYAFALTLEKEERITLFGRSLGSAFASYLAGKNHPQKVILETPFYSLIDVAKSLFPIYPNSLLLQYQFDNAQNLKDARAPIVIFHGSEDEVVPYSSGRKLHESLGNRSTLITVEGGHHNDLALYPEYWKPMENVLKNE